MDEDWDDGVTTASASSLTGVVSEGGTKFAVGRGFKAVDMPRNNWDNSASGWGGESKYNNADNSEAGEWQDASEPWGDSNGYTPNGDTGGRGRGRGRGGSGRSGRGGRGRGRGGARSEGRGGDWGNDDRYSSGRATGAKPDEGDASKPRDIYVPEERETSEELFTATITSGVNFVKLDEIEVKVTGENVPDPLVSFEKAGFRPHLLNNVQKSGYTKPTPIQRYAIPIIMAGRDIMGCAQTGSGKTAAFLLPMINKLMEKQDGPCQEEGACLPKVIVVSPTRELAIQIYDQARKFAHNSIVKCAVAYGGTSVSHQRNIVLAGCHILVATPGRLNDFVTKGHVLFKSVEYFVLDEADRMLDMGFLPTLEQMLGHASMIATGERQTLMFSATFPEEIQHLAGKFLHNYVFVVVGIVGSASTDVDQEFFSVSRFEKRAKLLELLKINKGRTVVFVETKRNADFLATLLSESDIKSTSIHGDRLQREREQALWDLKKGFCNIMVATGVAARGLDIEGIQHVINYDLPKSIDEYVHRIGRTGRVGNRGKATSFYDEACDRALAGPLANNLRQAGQEVPDFLANVGAGFDNGDDMFGGRDIRGDDFGQAQNYTRQPAEEAEDCW